MSTPESAAGVSLVAGDRLLITGQPTGPVCWWVRVQLWFRASRTLTDHVAGKPVRYKRMGRRTYVLDGGRWTEQRLNGIYIVQAPVA